MRNVLLLVLILSLAACSSLEGGNLDSGGNPDSGTPCDSTLTGVGTGSLIISEISPGNFIEFFNPTSADINLAQTNRWFCSPFNYVDLRTIVGSPTVPAGGYASIGWPGSFTDTTTGGEIILYKDVSGLGDFGDGSKILDFVCWGTNPHGTRKNLAETNGRWQASAACAGTLSNGSIHRRSSSAGTAAADYDVTAVSSRMDCTP